MFIPPFPSGSHPALVRPPAAHLCLYGSNLLQHVLNTHFDCQGIPASAGDRVRKNATGRTYRHQSQSTSSISGNKEKRACTALQEFNSATGRWQTKYGVVPVKTRKPRLKIKG
jgi:hypothetical protein